MDKAVYGQGRECAARRAQKRHDMYGDNGAAARGTGHAEKAKGVGAGGRTGRRKRVGRQRAACDGRRGVGWRHDKRQGAWRADGEREEDGEERGRHEGEQVREEPAAHDRTPYTTRPQRPSPQSTVQPPQRPHTNTPTLTQHTTSATVAAAREVGIHAHSARAT
jgi:hypothetical protein